MIDDPRIETGIMRGCLEAHFLENGSDFVVPMMRTAAEAVESLAEQPVFVGGVPRVTNRLTDNGEFIVRKIGLTKCIFAVALL
jgi:hypothetical protein